jgi:hypothetical protein
MQQRLQLHVKKGISFPYFFGAWRSTWCNLKPLMHTDTSVDLMTGAMAVIMRSRSYEIAVSSEPVSGYFCLIYIGPINVICSRGQNDDMRMRQYPAAEQRAEGRTSFHGQFLVLHLTESSADDSAICGGNVRGSLHQRAPKSTGGAHQRSGGRGRKHFDERHDEFALFPCISSLKIQKLRSTSWQV